MISGAEIKVNGRALDPSLHERLVEARYQDNLRLPDSLLVRVSDPGLENVDSSPLEIGADIELSLAAADATSLTSVFTGQIAAVEPEFTESGAILAARAYDGSHKLHQTKRTQTFQNMTAGDIARKVAQTEGMQTGTIDSAGPPHDFVQQNNETAWEFLWRLASRIDFEVLVIDKKLVFRKAGATPGAPKTLRWGENLLSFRPRVTGVQQMEEVVVRGWDPVARQAIEVTSQVQQVGSEIGISRSSVVSSFGGGTVTVADRPIASSAEATELAKSIASQLGNAYLEAEGTAKGDPAIAAGSKIKVEGIGDKYGGTYTLSSTTHVFRGARGYQTNFTIAGRSPRSLVDLMTPSKPKSWGNSVVIGTVTQNEDPDALGRVRVSYPALSGDAEGWWARVASPSAGKDRGLLMMPVVGDEVLVAFEHDDVQRPFVIGSLWNGKDTPGQLVQTDGSFALASDKLVNITAKDNISIKTDKDYTLETSGNMTQKPSGDLTLEAGGKVTVKAGSSVTIEGGSDITIKAGGASISVKSGMVQVSASQIMLG